MKTTEQLRAETQAIRDMLARGAESELRAIPGVTHVSVGLKEKDGRVTDQLCVRVYVARKRDSRDLPADQLIPKEVGGVPTDVNTVSTHGFLTDNSRYRPIMGGITITNRIVDVNAAGTGVRMSGGTLGCIAIDKTDNAPVMLSNWHVFTANSGRVGDKIFQPAPTSVRAVSLADLPLRPADDDDKVGVIRRAVVSEKVDAAIAAIDVSSCCHCCGVHFSNELKGLSVGGQPPRNTIVGHDQAVAGMTVFKVGRSTLRTEGVVVDASYADVDIIRDGVTHTFSGQMSIHNVDDTKPFSDRGDSGAVIVSAENKIVGLLFGSSVTGSVANHISDVFSALNIRIEYSPDVVVTAGAGLVDVSARATEAPVPEPYRAIRERMEQNENTALLMRLGERHRIEVVQLVNRCRAVMVAWQRAQGPAWLATLMRGVRDGRPDLPAKVHGVTLVQALTRMRAALDEYGSEQLRESLRSAQADLMLTACSDSNNLDDMIAILAKGTALAKEH